MPRSAVRFLSSSKLHGRPVAVEATSTGRWRRRTRVVVGDPRTLHVPFTDEHPDIE